MWNNSRIMCLLLAVTTYRILNVRVMLDNIDSCIRFYHVNEMWCNFVKGHMQRKVQSSVFFIIIKYTLKKTLTKIWSLLDL